jgi:hypothetical protein
MKLREKTGCNRLRDSSLMAVISSRLNSVSS